MWKGWSSDPQAGRSKIEFSIKGVINENDTTIPLTKYPNNGLSYGPCVHVNHKRNMKNTNTTQKKVFVPKSIPVLAKGLLKTDLVNTVRQTYINPAITRNMDEWEELGA